MEVSSMQRQSPERMSEGIMKNGPAVELVLWNAQCGLSSLVAIV